LKVYRTTIFKRN